MPTAIMLPSAISTHTQTGIGGCVGGGGMIGTDAVVKVKVADQSARDVLAINLYGLLLARNRRHCSPGHSGISKLS
ncbi:MAG: hypothetical protein WB588_07130 [Dehalococcoidia bacterium]